MAASAAAGAERRASTSAGGGAGGDGDAQPSAAPLLRSSAAEAEEEAKRQEDARAALLASRPFAEQLATVVASLQQQQQQQQQQAPEQQAAAPPLPAMSAAEAMRHMARLFDAQPQSVAAHPGIAALLAAVAAAAGATAPTSATAMTLLTRMSLDADGRAGVRAEALPALMPHIIGLFKLAASAAAADATVLSPPADCLEAAALLAANVASDRLARRALVAAGAVEALVGALAATGPGRPLGAAHAGPLACHLAGALMVLLTADSDCGGAASGGSGAGGSSSSSSSSSSGGGTCARARRAFVAAGGIEVACRALAERPRADGGRGTLRLRLLLAELAHADADGAWEARLHRVASEMASAALLATGGGGG